MFISSSLANTSSATSVYSMFTSMAPLLIIIAIFYFLVIRPQQKKIKSHQEMINHLQKGDRILTSGGIIAKILKVETENGVIVAEIAANVKVHIKKETISQVMNSDNAPELK